MRTHRTMLRLFGAGTAVLAGTVTLTVGGLTPASAANCPPPTAPPTTKPIPVGVSTSLVGAPPLPGPCSTTTVPGPTSTTTCTPETSVVIGGPIPRKGDCPPPTTGCPQTPPTTNPDGLPTPIPRKGD